VERRKGAEEKLKRKLVTAELRRGGEGSEIREREGYK